jgi:hypothetical protein
VNARMTSITTATGGIAVTSAVPTERALIPKMIAPVHAVPVKCAGRVHSLS